MTKNSMQPLSYHLSHILGRVTRMHDQSGVLAQGDVQSPGTHTHKANQYPAEMSRTLVEYLCLHIYITGGCHIQQRFKYTGRPSLCRM